MGESLTEQVNTNRESTKHGGSAAGEERQSAGNLKGCIFVTLNKDSESPRARETVAEEVRVMLLGRDEGEM